MTQNCGIFDRVVRIFAGYMIVSMFFLVDGDARWLALLGFAPMPSGVLGWCPLYVPFKIDTRAAPAT